MTCGKGLQSEVWTGLLRNIFTRSSVPFGLSCLGICSAKWHDDTSNGCGYSLPQWYIRWIKKSDLFNLQTRCSSPSFAYPGGCSMYFTGISSRLGVGELSSRITWNPLNSNSLQLTHTSFTAFIAHHVILIHHGDQFMVSSSVGKRNAQEGTKTHGMQLHSCDIALTCFWDWNALVQYLARHGCSTDLAQYRLHWEVRCWTELVPCQLTLSMRAGPAWHGSAQYWHTLVMFTLPLLIVPSHAGTVMARFQVAV